MERKTKIMGAGVAAAAAATAVGVGVAMARKNAKPAVFRVRPGDDGWTVLEDGADAAASLHTNKKDALSAGRKLAGGRAPSTLVLHYADGREQKRISYGLD
jgi:ABC-type sugar transport system substrate-binding protein